MRAMMVAIQAMLAAAPARAGGEADKAEAVELLREGNALAERGEYAEALRRFEAAYARYPSPKVLLNMGTARRALGQDAEALKLYERYLREGGGQVAPERRREVEGIVAELWSRLGRIDVRVDAAGAVVLLDGLEVGRSPLPGPLWVAPGAHRVEARAPGRPPAARTMRAAAGSRTAVALSVGGGTPPAAPAAPPAPAAGPPAPPAPPPSAAPVEVTAPAPAPSPGPPAWTVWTALGVAVAAAATGTLFGMRAQDASVDRDDAASAARVATAGWIAAGVSAAAGAGLLVWTFQ